MATKKEKKPEEMVYSILCVSSGNMLTGQVSWQWGCKKNEKQRTWEVSQFNSNRYVLDYLINNTPFDIYEYITPQQVWVKESEIDDLYGYIALATLTAFCDYYKHEAMFLAFLMHHDPALFLSYNGTKASQRKYLRDMKLGKQFLEWLESKNILSYMPNYRDTSKRVKFCLSEFELISATKKSIGAKIRRPTKG